MTVHGWMPTSKVERLPNVPSPLPRNTATSSSCQLAAAGDGPGREEAVAVIGLGETTGTIAAGHGVAGSVVRGHVGQPVVVEVADADRILRGALLVVDAVAHVGVVAALARTDVAITARGLLAGVEAGVGVDRVAVVARLAGLDDAVAADHLALAAYAVDAKQAVVTGRADVTRAAELARWAGVVGVGAGLGVGSVLVPVSVSGSDESLADSLPEPPSDSTSTAS